MSAGSRVIRLRKHRRRHHTLAYAALATLVFAVAIPAMLGSRGPFLGLSGSAVLAAARDSYDLATPVAIVPAAGLTLDRGTIMLATAQKGLMRNGEAILKMLLGGSARLMLDNARFSMDAPAAPNDKPAGWSEPPAPLLSALLDARFEHLGLRNASLDIRTQDGGIRRISDINATITAKRNGTVQAVGTLVYRGESIAFDTAAQIGDRSSAIRVPFRLSVKGKLIDATLSDARLSFNNGLQISAQRATLILPYIRSLASWLDMSWPDGTGLQKARIEGTLDLVNQTLAFQRARVELDGNEATGALLVNLGGPRPAFEGTLAVQTLDVSRYIEAAALDRQARSPEAGPPSDPARRVAGEGVFTYPILRYLDADLRISATRVVAGSLALGRSAAALSLRAGKLVADIAEIEIAEASRGNAQATIDMAGATPRFALRVRADGIDTETLGRTLFGRALMRGRGDLAVDLSGTGADVGPLVNTLSGKVALHMPRGGTLSLDVPALLAGAQAKAADDVWSGVVKGQTQVDELDAGFRIAQGVWTTEAVTARSGNALLTLTGIIDMPANEVDAVVSRTNTNRPVDFSGAETPQSVAHVRGPWMAPRVLPRTVLRKASELRPDAVRPGTHGREPG